MDTDLQELLTVLSKWTDANTAQWELDSDLSDAEHPITARRPTLSQATNLGIVGYTLHHAQYQVRLLCFDVAGDLDFVQISLESPSGGKLRTWALAQGSSEWQTVRGLLAKIKDRTTKGILDQFKSTDAPTQLDAKSAEFFKTIAGTWKLEYERDKKTYSEEINIDQKGNYCYLKDNAETLAFVLRDVYYDPDGRTVTFSKIEAAGARKGLLRHVEVLKIDPTATVMSGFAQHDRHSLKYTRLQKPKSPSAD